MEEQDKAAGEGPAAQADVESLKTALEAEKEKAQQYLANWQRSQADFINYKRRNEEERSEVGKVSTALFILNVLPVVDDLERALTSVPPELVRFTWLDGIRLIYRKLQLVLQSQGVEPIDALGQDFDPRFHEAVMHGEGDEGKVAAEVQRGYKMQGRVLRPALVVVGQGKPASGGGEAATPPSPPETPPGGDS